MPAGIIIEKIDHVKENPMPIVYCPKCKTYQDNERETCPVCGEKLPSEYSSEDAED